MPSLHRYPFTAAGMLIELTSPLSAAELGIEDRVRPFRGAPEDPLARVALRWEESPTPPVPRGDVVYNPGALWRMHRDGQDFYAAMWRQSSGRVAMPEGVLRANPNWDDLTLTEQRTGPPWQSLLSLGAGDLILRTAILSTGGLGLHASGLDDHGNGILFVGHSGVGKSTQLGLWSREPGVIAMNDDRLAVRADRAGSTPMCYGLPWCGKDGISRNHAAPLVALIVLEQAPENAIQQIPPAAAASLLAACAFLPHWDPALMQRAMVNLNAILARVPVFRLRCRPEMAVIPLVRAALCSFPTAS